MSEIEPHSNPHEALLIHDKELAHLGALMIEASLRTPEEIILPPAENTEGSESPNRLVSVEGNVHAQLQSKIGNIAMSSDSVYRQVHEAAVVDLANAGYVRNKDTAQGSSSKRWGDAVFWHAGKEGMNTSTGGRMVIEADKTDAEAGWVTADKVKAVYAQDTDGKVKNIIPQ